LKEEEESVEIERIKKRKNLRKSKMIDLGRRMEDVQDLETKRNINVEVLDREARKKEEISLMNGIKISINEVK
jgi:hypothetical protein